MITFDSDFMEVLIEHNIDMTIDIVSGDPRFTFMGKDQFGNDWSTSHVVNMTELMLFASGDANTILGEKVDNLIDEIKYGQIN